MGKGFYWTLHCRATFKNSNIGTEIIGGSQSTPDMTFVPRRCLSITCIDHLFGLQEKIDLCVM